jgi:hypothetical protein
LKWNSLLEVAFVGSENRNLPTFNIGSSGYNGASDLNVIPLGSMFSGGSHAFTSSELPASVSSGSSSTSAALGGLNTPQTDFFRNYPFYQHVYVLKHNYYSNYNSLQVAWNKSSGMVSWGANYTFSKDLATAASYNNNLADPINLRNDYNPAPFDRTHVINAHYLVNLGKRYNGGNHLLYAVANGWQISGISTWQSGPNLASEQGESFSFGSGNLVPTQLWDSTQSQGSSQNTTCQNTYGIQPDKNGHTYCVLNINSEVWMGTPDYLLMPTLKCDPVSGLGKHQYMKATCFGVPLPGSPTSGQYALSSNPSGQGVYRLPYIHGPAYMQHNISLFKHFAAGEGKDIELRASAFNFLNHPLVSFNNNDNSNLNLGNVLNAVPGQALTQAQLGYKNFGIANVKYGSRLMELSAKYTF